MLIHASHLLYVFLLSLSIYQYSLNIVSYIETAVSMFYCEDSVTQLDSLETEPFHSSTSKNSIFTSVVLILLSLCIEGCNGHCSF